MAGRLKNKNTLITAAGMGIGRSSVMAFVHEGARVLATDIDPESLASLKEECPEIETSLLDITNAEAIQAIAKETGTIDVSVSYTDVFGNSPDNATNSFTVLPVENLVQNVHVTSNPADFVIITDTHSRLDEQIRNLINKKSYVIHAGDIGDINIISDLKSQCKNIFAVNAMPHF